MHGNIQRYAILSKINPCALKHQVCKKMRPCDFQPSIFRER